MNVLNASTRTLSLAALSLLVGCSRTPEPSSQLRIGVSPLQLDDVEEVVYGLRVLSSEGVVWEQTGLSSDSYGDGKSALTYVGPCDATANPHTVELTIESLRAGGRKLIDPDDWRNPAPAGRPVRRTPITCVENGDTPVDFNLTVLRSANQGFFDIAVEFSDIFCSAKVDCSDALLHNRDGERDATVVVALACTAGETQQTHVYLSDLVLSCDDADPNTPPVVYTLPAKGLAPGQHGPVKPGIFEWAAYQGDEQLTSNGNALEKCYWNRAIGLDRAALAGMTCTVSALATASEAPLAGNALPAWASAYPVIAFDVQVLGPDGTLCGPNPLDGDGSGVQTRYVTADTELGTLLPLTGHVSCGADDAPKLDCPVPNWPTAGAPAAITVTQQDSALTVSHGGRASTVTLPPGYTLGTSCCADACCAGTP